MAERRRALIIANSNYQDSAFQPLTAPEADASEMARVLGQQEIGGFEVTTMVNEGSNAVNHAIEDFFCFSDPRPEDFLLLYFSGHGITDEEGQLYFATCDTRLEGQRIRRTTAVGAEFVNMNMKRCRARRQVLVLDCCHSGAFAGSMRLKGQPLRSVETHFQGKGRIVLTASTGMQFSREGGDSDKPQPSIYTRLFVKALETGDADRDGNGQIDLDELHDYLVEQIRAEAPEQTPTKSGYVEGHLFIARTARMRTVALPAHLQSHLSAPRYEMRMAAAYGLRMLLEDQNQAMALTARRALEKLRKEDESQRVRDEAAKYLAAFDGGRNAGVQLAKQRDSRAGEKAKVESAPAARKKIEEKRVATRDEARQAARELAAARVLERSKRMRARAAERKKLETQRSTEKQDTYVRTAPGDAIEKKTAAPAFGNSKVTLFVAPDATSKYRPVAKESTSSVGEVVILVIAILVINALGAIVGAQMANFGAERLFKGFFVPVLFLTIPGMMLGAIYRKVFGLLAWERFRSAALAMWPGFLIGFEFLNKVPAGNQPALWIPLVGVAAFLYGALTEGGGRG